MEQAHADEPLVVIDALDDVSAQLELADDASREVNPAGEELGKGDRLVAGPAQALEQPLLLAVSERHRRIGCAYRVRLSRRRQSDLSRAAGGKLRCWCDRRVNERLELMRWQALRSRSSRSS
jgi:hypothetical protein